MGRPRKTADSQTGRRYDVQSKARVVEAICALVEAGTPLEPACDLNDLASSTLWEWMQGDDAIAKRVRKARAIASEEHRLKLEAQIAGDSRTANVRLALMGRLYPGIYGEPKQTVEHIQTQAPITVKPLEAETAEETAQRRAGARALKARNSDEQEKDGDE